MALEAGVLSITLEFGKDLKDRDLFGKQDPYCIVKVGGQQLRTKTAKAGGRNPVWNETFDFNVINENSVEVQLFDEDTFTRDDVIGVATFSIAQTREQGTDRQQVPVLSVKTRKQHGFISVAMKFVPNRRQ